MGINLDTGGQLILGGAGAVVLVAALLLLRVAFKVSNSSVASFVDAAKDELLSLRREHRLCNRRLSILVAVLQQNGINVPLEVWNDATLSDLDEEEPSEGTTWIRKRR